MERAREAAEAADLVLYVIDGVRGADAEDMAFLDALTARGRAAILVINKSDLAPDAEAPAGWTDAVVRTQAKHGAGIDALADAIYARIIGDARVGTGDGAVVSNARHLALLERCRSDLESFLDGLDMGMSKDILVIDLQNAWENLGLITGDTASEDLIDTIFSKFCLGK